MVADHAVENGPDRVFRGLADLVTRSALNEDFLARAGVLGQGGAVRSGAQRLAVRQADGVGVDLGSRRQQDSAMHDRDIRSASDVQWLMFYRYL